MRHLAKTSSLLSFAGLALALGVATTSCKKDEQPPAEPLIRPVRYIQVKAARGVRQRTFSGAAKPGAEIKLSFKVEGTLQRLPVKVGDAVAEGDLIAELDPRHYELQVEEIRAALSQARAKERYAKAELARIRGLYENNNASLADLDAARSAAESAAAVVRSTEKKLEMAQLHLSYTTLKSPVDGVVARVAVEVNENIRPGQTIVTINSGARPQVEVAVPESLITQIHRGRPVTVKFDALGDRLYHARITEVGVSPGQSATTFPVTVELDRPNPRVLPGMAAEVSFTFPAGGSKHRFIVPSNAVSKDREGNFVFIVQPGEAGLGTVTRRSVKVGAPVTGGLEVLQGLQDGDLVVTAGLSQITDGQQVKLLGPDQH